MKRVNKMSYAEEKSLKENPIHEFTCQGCEKNQPMSFEDFKKHLSEVHKLMPDQLKGKRSMTMHMDGDKWFSSTYEWMLESGLKFIEYYMMARSNDDPMRY